MTSLSGPRLPPAKGAATHLVVLLHGYGSDGNDLIGLAPHLQQRLPSVAFVAPNAPARVEGSGGYQWFPLTRMDPRELERGVEAARPAVDRFLDEELARLSLPPDRLVMAGFSQGTMLSLHVGLRRAVKPAAIIGFSGLLPTKPPQGDKPPILLTHGDADTVIPPQAMLVAAIELGAAGAAVQWHLGPGIGHGIDPDGLSIATEFLARALQGQLKTEGEICCPLTQA
ncbi:MAG TPA: prolyl oligopeptidase family serine peptidase [Rhizomicrobium sp.]|jgi:phospholipase/carboxylesterase|nr:prolyl oligopeptidase family serine peptidase [Rhizomicrobium sp.]